MKSSLKSSVSAKALGRKKQSFRFPENVAYIRKISSGEIPGVEFEGEAHAAFSHTGELIIACYGSSFWAFKETEELGLQPLLCH